MQSNYKIRFENNRAEIKTIFIKQVQITSYMY